MSEPILRLTIESGSVYDDPSEELLYLLFQDVDNGSGTYLILDALTDKSGQTYAQALRDASGSWVVEYREGSPDRHFASHGHDRYTAHAILAGWAFNLPDWKARATWSKLDL